MLWIFAAIVGVVAVVGAIRATSTPTRRRKGERVPVNLPPPAARTRRAAGRRDGSAAQSSDTYVYWNSGEDHDEADSDDDSDGDSD